MDGRVLDGAEAFADGGGVGGGFGEFLRRDAAEQLADVEVGEVLGCVGELWGERDITPRVRWSVPTGLTAFGGTGVWASTSFRSCSRAVEIWERFESDMRGRQRKCVNGGFLGLLFEFVLSRC